MTAQLRYYLSDKGTETRKKQKFTRRLMTACCAFMEDNPGSTVEDFLKTLEEEEIGQSGNSSGVRGASETTPGSLEEEKEDSKESS